MRDVVEVKRKLGQNKDAIIAAYEAGDSSHKIGARYDLDKSSILLLLRKNLVPVRQGASQELRDRSKEIDQIFKQHEDDIISDYQAGLSICAIGRKYDLYSKSVKRRLAKSGIIPSVKKGIKPSPQRMSSEDLRTLRVEMRYSQKQVGDALGISNTYISNLENGRTASEKYHKAIQSFLVNAKKESRYGSPSIGDLWQKTGRILEKYKEDVITEYEAGKEKEMETAAKPVTSRGMTLEMIQKRKGSEGLLKEAEQELAEMNESIESVNKEVAKIDQAIAYKESDRTTVHSRNPVTIIRQKREIANEVSDLKAQRFITEAPLEALEKGKAWLIGRVSRLRNKVREEQIEKNVAMIAAVKQNLADFVLTTDRELEEITAGLNEIRPEQVDMFSPEGAH